MRRNNITRVTALLCLSCALLWFLEGTAAADDFGNIVHRIEGEYHVHRHHRFLVAFAGAVINVSHFAGAKGFKAAIFDNQYLLANASDAQLDRVIQSASKSGWQPLIKSYSPRTGEHHYIYVQGHSNELKLLFVSVEPDEAVVVQAKIDANKLSAFINEHSSAGEQDRD